MVFLACLLVTEAILMQKLLVYPHDGINSLWLFVVLVLFTLGVTILFLLSLHGFYIWSRGPLPIQSETCESGTTQDDTFTAHHTTSADGKQRTIEYFVWGSQRPDATVVVYLHGSNTTGKLFNAFLFPNQVLQSLNVKAISPSYPGHGNSDMDPFRSISHWPTTDLKPVLDDQKVLDKFMVIGSSYGTAHAMATAACFPDQCLAMGLNVPYLPEPICREFKFPTDADMILQEDQLKKPWIVLPLLSIFSILVQNILGVAIGLFPEGRKLALDDPELFRIIQKDAKRSFLRGVNGQIYEMLNAQTTQHWQDPRTHNTTKNVAVWYATDDTAVPPVHGKWLANLFSNNNRLASCSVRATQTGLGHFTYMDYQHRQTAVMTKELLEMMNNETTIQKKR